MTKYLAIIKDSFREAIASRVLWLVLLMITALLLAIGPLGYREELTWRLRDNDVNEWPDLMQLVRTEGKQQENIPSARIWELLDENLQNRLVDVKIPGIDQDAANPFAFLRIFGEFREAVNGMLEDPDFYSPEKFQGVQMLSSELRSLRNEGLENLSADEVARFNRLVMEASFPDLVRGSPQTSIQLRYAWWDLLTPIPLRGATLRETIQSRVVTSVNWFVGAIGVFVAILVTAPIIPQMFDAGSLHLLLSKPISRSLLFLSKFCGGCAFITICAAYLIVGLWLILGMRFAIWEPKLLWSIPIYLFVFAIYYCVSALASVVWRSPIVSIALTIVFWLSCFVVGITKGTFERTLLNKARWIKILDAGDEMLAVNETGIAHRWNSESREWDEIFVTAEQRQSRGVLLFMPAIPRAMRPAGPVYDAANEQLVSVQPSFPPGDLHLYSGRRDEDWNAVTHAKAPTGTIDLFRESSGTVLAVSSLGLFRLDEVPTETPEPMNLFGLEIPLNMGGPFRKVSPDPPLLITQPAAAAFDPETELLCVYTRGTLTLLRGGESSFETVVPQVQLDGEERQPAVLAIADDVLMVGREDGRIELRDLDNLEVKQEFQPNGSVQPRFLSASSDGQHFAVVFHDGELWTYNGTDNEFQRAGVTGQGDISAASFNAAGELLVADRTIRVSRYDPSSTDLIERFSPKLGLLESGYRYGLLPLYTLFPKPGELDTTVQYLLSGEETEAIRSDDLAVAQQKVDPWTPLWSSALFMVVVLLVSCLYIEWQDF